MKRPIFVLFLLAAAFIALVPRAAAAQVVPNADLAIVANSADIRHGHVGQEITFTIVAINNGPDAVVNFFVRAVSLQNLHLVQEICDFGVSPDRPNCEYSNVQPGEELTTRVVAEIVAPSGKSNHIAALEACASSGSPINDPNPGNNCATAMVRIVGKR
jgi:uncharacterized repeat protein (TIGR01451 family)